MYRVVIKSAAKFDDFITAFNIDLFSNFYHLHTCNTVVIKDRTLNVSSHYFVEYY